MRECQLSETTNLRCLMANPLRNVLVSHVWAAKHVKLGPTRHHYSGIRIVKANWFCRLYLVVQEGIAKFWSISRESVQKTWTGTEKRNWHIPSGSDKPFSLAAAGGGGQAQRHAPARELR